MKSIQIIRLAETEPFTVTLKLRFSTNKIMLLQFQPDNFTYHQLRKVAFPQFLNHETNHIDYLIPLTPQNDNTNSNIEWVIWNVRGQSKKFSFSCSPAYKIFINKLKTAGNREDLHKIFYPAGETLKDDQTPEEKQYKTINRNKNCINNIIPGMNDTAKTEIHPFLQYVYSLSVLVFYFFLASFFNITGPPSGALTTNGNIISIVKAVPSGLNLPGEVTATGKVDRAGEVAGTGPENQSPGSTNGFENSAVTSGTGNFPQIFTRDEFVKDSTAGTDRERSWQKEIIYFLPEGKVALTFDDGPSEYTREILKVLEEYQVPATFFFIGQNISRYPEAVEAVREQGYGVGLHSFSHKAMQKLSFDQQEEEINRGLAALKPYAGRVTLFRPPYGTYNKHTIEILNNNQMSMVLWNRDPRDWQARTAHEIIHGILNTPFSGGIYLLHEKALTLKTLPRIIEAFQEEGLEFLNLEQEISCQFP